jgi:branched-subunit amino acid transport protein AzlD
VNLVHSLLIIGVTALSTLITRSTPFLLFGRGEKRVGGTILYIGKILPPAIMATLLVYALKEISFGELSGWLFDLGAIAVTALIHLKWRNALISIAVGTILYMVLVQGLFW